MQCAECNAAGAQPVRVIFSEDHVDNVILCNECLGEFRDSDLVADVVPPRTPWGIWGNC